MLVWLPNYGNTKTTQESTKIRENMPEINDIGELTECIYFLWITDQYQRKDPSWMAKNNNPTYKPGFSRGRSNIKFKPITCEDKMYVP